MGRKPIVYLGKGFRDHESLERFKKFVLPKIKNRIVNNYHSDKIFQEVYGNLENYVRYELGQYAKCNSRGIKYKVGMIT